jgi:hypothetical protein
MISVVVGVTLATLGGVGRASALPALSLAGEGEVLIEANGGSDTATTELFVIDSGREAAITVEFLASESGDAKLTSFEPKRVSAEGATPVKLTFSGMSHAAAGALVIKGGRAPLVRETKLSPGLRPERNWPETLVIGALIATALLVGAIMLLAKVKGQRIYLGKKAPGPKWSFESWATTLTAVGAIVGTVVASAAYPSDPVEISKDSLVAMTLLFGALVVIAPFVFQALRNPRSDAADQEAGLWGYSWALLLACAITCWAVLGELGCLSLLCRELIGSGGWRSAALAAIGALAAMALYYFWVTVSSLAKTDWEAVVSAGPTASNAEIKVSPDAEKRLYIGVAGPPPAGDEEAPPAAVTEPNEVAVLAAAPRARTWSLP